MKKKSYLHLVLRVEMSIINVRVRVDHTPRTMLNHMHHVPCFEKQAALDKLPY